jgi:2-amino-4-hydroxy-6-hydroxymethyldihydropteridine diphosphokinase
MASEVIVALGSNLKGEYESSEALLEAALARFGAYGAPVVRRSSYWESAAWPDPAEPAYLNAVALVDTLLPPLKLLSALRRLEASFGRERGRLNAPRTLDLDLIAYADEVLDAPGLTLPHPRAHERLFVVGPIAEAAPSWVHPVLGRTAAELAAAAVVGADARPLAPRPHAASLAPSFSTRVTGPT